jgi:hypothetical protein
MATTTNYSWTTPDDTALVKDGALAIRTLGSSVDTTVKNLNPETTTGAISYRGATANQKVALPIGTANQVLRVNSGATAPEWATVSSGGMTSIASGSLSGSSVVLGSIPATYNRLILELRNWYNSLGDEVVHVRMTGVTTGYGGNSVIKNGDTYGVGNSGTTSFTLSASEQSKGVDDDFYLVSEFPNYADTTSKKLCLTQAAYYTNGDVYRVTNTTVYNNSTSAIDSLTISVTGAATFSGGTYILWGLK